MRVKRRGRALRITLQVILVISVLAGVRAWQQRGVLSTGPAPAFAGVTITGDAMTLADYRGRPVLVYFWATWCPLCGLAQETIHRLARDYPVVTIALEDTSDSGIQAYLVDRQVSYPVIADRDGALARRYGVRAVPTSFVIDATGTIRFVETGYTTQPGLQLRLWLAQNDW